MGTAFVFPGQGSQQVGMGKALADQFPAAKAVFDEVDAALGEKLSAILWNGPEDQLTLTANTQPALLAVSIAALRVLEQERGVRLADLQFVAGHSLGEYSALCASGALSLADAARLLRVRGNAMQAAVPVGKGGMTALIGTDIDQAREIAKEAAQGEVLEVANDNGGGQVVVSGDKTAADRVIEIAKAKGVKRALPLPVSAPFHSPLMAPAAEIMREALALVTVNTPAVPVVANMTARPVTDPDTIRKLLVEQVTGTVRWRESVAFMAGAGVTRFVEVGSGKVLAGLVKRIADGAEAQSVGTPDDISAFTV
ncbi:malonyl CoA-acyl carrier protein transacylase [Terrihabitans soli]|uniref:Malonyl CoA-acyl carrier protein transacylase n=1 Tax=Terrihabitans soli TaxID=708113 RepID=A0A6S6QTB9_9HYPH|nr:ACP S-malonyltransferase [Terrihabitans soli]BCJ90845.1 malonyl CoA-acyl carrier protein transacylase [Terrihabitans soli]